MSLINLATKRTLLFGYPHINFLAKSTNVDAIDSFTTELVEKKAIKWNLLRKLRPSEPAIQYSTRKIFKEIHKFRHQSLLIDLTTLNEAQIDNLVTSSMQTYDNGNPEDFDAILGQCCKCERSPSNPVALQVLHFLGTSGKIEQLADFTMLLRKLNANLCSTEMNLLHFEALCFWKCGNVDKALVLLKNAFELQPDLEDAIYYRKIVEKIVEETIGHKSEGVLVSLTNLGTHFAEHYNDYFVLAHIWTQCFVSEWFSDQQIAIGLFHKSEELREFVGRKTRLISFTLLRKHDVDGVHRLIELFLKYDMKPECHSCLSLLFDYQYWRKDLRACSEIMQSCLTMDLPLSNVQNQQLLNLLIGRSANRHSGFVKSEIKQPTFKLKF